MESKETKVDLHEEPMDTDIDESTGQKASSDEKDPVCSSTDKGPMDSDKGPMGPDKDPGGSPDKDPLVPGNSTTQSTDQGLGGPEATLKQSHATTQPGGPDPVGGEGESMSGEPEGPGPRLEASGGRLGLSANEEEDKEIDKLWIKAGKTACAVPMETRDSWWGRSWSQRDTDDYRKGYPKKTGSSIGRKNLEFYTNQRRCEPDGLLIDEIHSRWPGDYRTLEYNHGYIQWLFPIRERGLNWEAQELNEEEIHGILADDEAKKRILRSYEMMLGFYGMRLQSAETGKIERAGNWRDRFQHLNYSMHNYMRITRILKCLGEFEYEHLKAPFIRFVLEEAIVEGTLSRTLDSCKNYWVQVLKDDKERKQMENYCQLLYAHKKEQGKKKRRISPVGNLGPSPDQSTGSEFSSDEETTGKRKQKHSKYKEFSTIA